MSLFKKSIYSALVFFGTLMVLSVGYAVWNNVMGQVSSGDTLTAGKWNAFVDNINDLNSRWSRVGSDVAFTGGNVGIGTASPSVKLDVFNNGSTIISTDGTHAGEVGYRIAESGISKWYLYKPVNSLDFHIYESGYSSRLIVQNVTGNIGIGTTSPSAKLDVVGRIVSTITSNANNKHLSFSGTAGNTWDMYGGHGGGGYFGISENAGTPTFVIQATTGNVGIGTVSPESASKLDVNGQIKIGDGSATCNSTRAGVIRWNGTNFYGCNGTTWMAFY